MSDGRGFMIGTGPKTEGVFADIHAAQLTGGDAYGQLVRVEKAELASGVLIAIEGITTFGAHQTNGSRYYGLVGDARSLKNDHDDTYNIAVWGLADRADVNVAFYGSRGASVFNDYVGVGLHDPGDITAHRLIPSVPDYQLEAREWLVLSADQPASHRSFSFEKRVNGQSLHDEDGAVIYVLRNLSGVTAALGSFITCNNGEDVFSVEHDGAIVSKSLAGTGTRAVFTDENGKLIAP